MRERPKEDVIGTRLRWLVLLREAYRRTRSSCVTVHGEVRCSISLLPPPSTLKQQNRQLNNTQREGVELDIPDEGMRAGFRADAPLYVPEAPNNDRNTGIFRARQEPHDAGTPGVLRRHEGTKKFETSERTR